MKGERRRKGRKVKGHTRAIVIAGVEMVNKRDYARDSR